MSVQSFGKVIVATPGTPVQATHNQSTPSDRVGLQSVQFQALPGNAGIVYIGIVSTMDRSTLVGVLALLAKPANATTGPFPSQGFSIPADFAGLNLANFYIDADNASDGVVISGTVG